MTITIMFLLLEAVNSEKVADRFDMSRDDADTILLAIITTI